MKFGPKRKIGAEISVDQWHDWFAWHPVTLPDGFWHWWEPVQRKGTLFGYDADSVHWVYEYRAPPRTHAVTQ